MSLSFTLRPYQQTFADAVVTHLAKYKRVIACAATGSGKTKTFIYLAHRAQMKGLTVLILTESSKIYEQLTAELKAGNINADVRDTFIQPNHIYIAMAQTLVRRPKMVAAFKQACPKLLIITDEAHIGTPTKLLQQFPEALHIGFTATPDWKSAKHLPLLYNACVVGPQPDELINSGHLVSYQHFARVLIDMNVLKIGNGEFTEASQEAAFESRKVYDGLIDDLRRIPYRKAIIFCASIKHCNEVYNQLSQVGIPSIPVHSKIEKGVQSYNMQLFKTGSINVCVSVGILTKGWDFPPLDLVILNRATTSLPLYMQMIGRGSRPCDGKQVFTVIDYGENFKRHGLWDAEVDWGKKWKEVKKKKDGIAPVKMCPKCEYINTAAASVCKNCGYKFEAPAPEPNAEETKLIEITKAYRNLIGKRVSQLTPIELALYAKFKNKKAFAIRIASSLSQSQSNSRYLEEFAKAMGYKSGWKWLKWEELRKSHPWEKNREEPKQVEFTDIILK
jgi:superfamily II DNA or RNA helicase